VKIGSWLAARAEKAEAACRMDMMALFDRNPDARVLDLGCADGTITVAFSQRIGSARIQGIEAVAENIAAAQSKGIDARPGDLNRKLPFEDAGFDVIIASHVIEHLSDTDNFVREVYRVLKPGGYVVLATPNLAAWLNVLFLVLGRQPTIAEVSDDALVGTWSPRGGCVSRVGPAHRRVFTMGAARGLLEYYGFKIERAAGSGYLLLPARVAAIMTRLDSRHATNIIVKARKG
jgi:methionine biosynthesis protein MetW